MEKHHKKNAGRVIEKLSISLETEKHDSQKITEKCSALFKSKLRYLINDEVGKWPDQDNAPSLRKIVFNLGEIDLNNFEQQFIWRLERELKNKANELKENIKQHIDDELTTARRVWAVPDGLRGTSEPQRSNKFAGSQFEQSRVGFPGKSKISNSALKIENKEIESDVGRANGYNQQRYTLQDNGDISDISSVSKHNLKSCNTLYSESLILDSVDNYLNLGDRELPILWQQIKSTEFSDWLTEKINLRPQQWLTMLAKYCLHPEKTNRLIKICQPDVLSMLFNLFSGSTKKTGIVNSQIIASEKMTPEKLSLSAKHYLEHKIQQGNNTDSKVISKTKNKLIPEQRITENHISPLIHDNNETHILIEPSLRIQNNLISKRDIAENYVNSLKPDHDDFRAQTTATLGTLDKGRPTSRIAENHIRSLKPGHDDFRAQTTATLGTLDKGRPTSRIAENHIRSLKPDHDDFRAQTTATLGTLDKGRPTSRIAENSTHSLQLNNNKCHTLIESPLQTKIKKTSAVNIHQNKCDQLKQIDNNTHIQKDARALFTRHLIQPNHQSETLEPRDGLIKEVVKQAPSIRQNKALPRPALSTQILSIPPNNGIQTSSAQSVLSISNAGCILLWPLLPAFFRSFDLLEKNTFVSLEAQRIAVCLLDWLIWAEEEIPAWRLTLNKVLCGLSIHDNALWLAPKPEQQIAINQWLEKTLVQLPAWKKMGVNDVRHLFLQRSGELSELNGLINIHIKPEVYDALINEWPWPINIARFGWLEQTITTTWL
ncbi:contractile injection system tape measure protein [Xenorhabdus szentirmaii]|uniref:contractile injection system tape measure protein n=2 Tax=Xenorhabdus szentirmaii TaxID=290112 RepID=UPI0032B7AD09